jgi:hypothetical protein
MQIAVLGIDLGKNSCSVVGLNQAGRVVLRRRLHRDRVINLAAGMSGCVMASTSPAGTRARPVCPVAVIQVDIYPIPKRDFGQFEKNPKFFQTAR